MSKILSKENWQKIITQAQVFASAWAFVDGPFATDTSMQDAEDVKADLIAMFDALPDAPSATLKIAHYEWIAKTDWCKPYQPQELGLHRADVIRLRFEALQERLSSLQEQQKNTVLVLEKMRDVLRKVADRFFPARTHIASQDLLHSEVHSAINLTPEITKQVLKNEVDHLDWIYQRMTDLHGENPNVDYMRKFRSIIDSLQGEK